MPVLSIRFKDADLVPLRAYARAHQLDVSTAIRQLARMGLAGTRGAPAPKINGALVEQIAHRQMLDARRIDDLINLCVQLLTITRVFAQASDKALLDQALQSAKQAITDLNVRRVAPAAAALLHDNRSSP
jgi:hypothetical protein